ncbi:MAG: PLP-dependent transferase [Negativicutes bacterium]|nr:PLP-dependent transferase [Negativicutes bacterium]MBP8629767.1 PLP-dependent transferase [Negativicutes bacterium]MBP9537784.1 PLP-dependent transferase [Negativicutes bacterium]MBP9949939.1 PLP-dependent transferase [Negativicutes bacterium]
MKIKTKCVHGNIIENNPTGAISVPIYQAATFVHPGVGQSTGYDYSRLQNPTREHVEKIVANLENGIDALAFSSGMAAIMAVMELFEPQDHIICSDDLYGGSQRLFDNISKKNQLAIDYIDSSNSSAVKNLINNKTKAIYIETPTNPLMKVSDIKAIAEIAQENKLLLIVDNTFLTPYFQKPLDLGADIVVHSGTKYLAGHNDTLAGFLVVKENIVAEKLRFIYKTIGACLAPFDSWLVIRGLKTLALRLAAQESNAVKIANYLKTVDSVKKVYYIGLPEHPSYDITLQQSSGFGAMISFAVNKPAVAIRLLEKIKVVQYAESLGGVESLLTYPMLQTHADVPPEIRQAKGIDEHLLRLSVGIEDVEDLIADLEQAFEED